MKKIKKYRVTPDESLCLAVSVVDKPAVESEFVYMSEQKQENFVAVEKKEKRMIYGCALRCDFPIYRNSKEKGEYYLEFDAEAIDKISKDFMKNGFQSNWTVGHEAEVEGLTVTELWIKESPTMDKSVAIGLDPSIPVGSLFLGCYCENDDVWNAVKAGKYHGFSCEALVGVEEFEAQIPEQSNVGKEEKPTEESVVEENLEEEKPVEAPVAEEPKAEEKPAEEVKVEEPKAEEEQKEEVKPEEPKQDNHLEDLINSLKSEIEALKEMNGGLQEKIKALGKQPSTKPVSTTAKPNPTDTYSQWRQTMKSLVN